ncbi:30S ribosomal protein S18 [Patescibacteria group bacterium]
MYIKVKQCPFCTTNTKIVDYKNSDLLKKYMNPQSKILPRRRTGICAIHQRSLTRAIRRARTLALIPFTTR